MLEVRQLFRLLASFELTKVAWERDSSIAPSEAGDLDRPLSRSVTISNESAIPPASQSRIPSQSPPKVAGNVATAAAARRAQYESANGGNRR
jgi:hypothetical protein